MAENHSADEEWRIAFWTLVLFIFFFINSKNLFDFGDYGPLFLIIIILGIPLSYLFGVVIPYSSKFISKKHFVLSNIFIMLTIALKMSVNLYYI